MLVQINLTALVVLPTNFDSLQHLFPSVRMFTERLSEAKGLPEQLKPDAILARIVLLVPDEYRTNRQYPFCLQMLEEGEWGLALESLLDLAEETGYSFNPEIWQGLAIAAEKMNMSQQAQFYR